MFGRDYPVLGDVTVPEIIDELEKQFDDKLCDLQGVRLVATNVYICLSKKESVQHLSTYGFYVRGVPVKVRNPNFVHLQSYIKISDFLCFAKVVASFSCTRLLRKLAPPLYYLSSR